MIPGAGGEIDALVQLLSRLPGFGQRSARRAILHLLARREAMMLPLADGLRRAAETVLSCSVCGNFDSTTPCALCTDPKRDRSQICVVEDVADLWAIERTGAFFGLYHVLGGVLSAIDGTKPDDLRIGTLVTRATDPTIREVIFALNATMEAQSTVHYIMDRLAHLPIKRTRLAHGVPIGGELDYLDEGTLTTALKSRRDL